MSEITIYVAVAALIFLVGTGIPIAIRLVDKRPMMQDADEAFNWFCGTVGVAVLWPLGVLLLIVAGIMLSAKRLAVLLFGVER